MPALTAEGPDQSSPATSLEENHKHQKHADE